MINLFEGHWIKDLALLGVDAVANGKPIVDLERQLSSLEAQRMIDGRYVEQSGTYPFMLYYFKRKNEIACVRTILTGKANGLDGEQIKRRLITSCKKLELPLEWQGNGLLNIKKLMYI